jgi:ATP-dependent DNA ligase
MCNQKRSYRHYGAACPPGRIHRACLPTKTDKLPSGSQWLHEINHDGFRIIARKTGAQVRLYSRPGNDLTSPFR